MMKARKHPRVSLDVDVVVSINGQRLTGRAAQIGAGGMSLELAASVPVSHPVELEFTLPDGPPVRVAGVVWWKKGKQIGVRFDYTGTARLTVENWVNGRLRDAQYFPKPI
jgi:hypothetical protein